MALSRRFASGTAPQPRSTGRSTLLATACAAVLLSACAGMGGGGSGAGVNMPPTIKIASGVLTDPQGLTLYTFDRDTANSGKSVCNGPCATNWPPLLAQPGTSPTGSYTIITRDDGTRQWAYRGKPLYRFAKDAKPGDRSGDNLNNVWHVAKP
jgi:predicted lipoprotein with Yx(FWY)xxD motif